MTYQDFQRPRFSYREHTGDEWLSWLSAQQGALMPVSPRHGRSCAKCYGASAYFDGGPATWGQCFNCRQYGRAVDCYVPVTYSIDMGLESMLHRFKDFPDYGWLRYPLSCLLHEFLAVHGSCIEHQTPRRIIDVATVVPSNDPRSFSHLDQLISGPVAGDPLLQRWNWEMDFLARDPTTSRPNRGELKPSAYNVAPFVIEESSVLLLDDTWTSGASAASSAAALKDAGARHVTVLSLGRQLRSAGYGSSAELYDDRLDADWSLDGCVLCA